MARLFLVAAVVAAQASSVVYASNSSTSRKLLTATATCPANANCVSSVTGTVYKSGTYYLSQTPVIGGVDSGKYNWNTPNWQTGGVCSLVCASMVNCQGVGGSCATINSNGKTGSVDCNYRMFSPNYCDAQNLNGGGSSAYPSTCQSGGAGTAMSVLCQCPAPTTSQYTVTPCGGCSGGYCSTINTNAQCTATCPAGSYTSDTCGLGTVMYQPGDSMGNGNRNQNGNWNQNQLNQNQLNQNQLNQNNNCPCANRQPVNIKTCPCAVASPPPPPSPSPPPPPFPPAPAYLKNLGNGNGIQVGQDTQCTACSACRLGYTVSAPCVAGTMSSLGQDTQCSQCAAVPANAAYVAAGSCAWKCADGFMASGNACVKSPVSSPPMPPPTRSPPPPPSPSPPPPPKVYSSSHVLTTTNNFGPKVTGGPTQHVLNGGATTTSTETTADGKVLHYVTSTTTDVTQQATGLGHVKAQSTATTTTDVGHPQTFVKHNSPPPSPSPPPPKVYMSNHVLDMTTGFGPKVTGGPTQHVLNGGATTTSTETTADGKVLHYVTTTTTDATQQGTGNGHIKAHSTDTSTTATGNQQTYQKHNPTPSPNSDEEDYVPASTRPSQYSCSELKEFHSDEPGYQLPAECDDYGHAAESPPPTVYTSTHVVDRTTGFGPKVTGGPNQHVLNGGATTTSTETTATGKVKQYITTTTTDATQQGTGNGHITAQSTDTSTTATDHQQTYQKHNTHTTTTDLPAVHPSDLPAAPSVCGGKVFAVQSSAKSALCMHVKGGVGPDGFTVSTTVKRPVITMPCNGSPNQQFAWVPSANGGVLVHNPSTLALSLATTPVSDGTGVLLAANSGALSQEWVWNDAITGGTISSVANDNFMITDSRVNADVSVGLPVHMWHLAKSLPSGAPNAEWYANCGV